MDTTSFFEDALPVVIRHHSSMFNTGQGRVCVVVQGVGEWTIRFGDHRADDAVARGLDIEADLVASWGQEGFEALLAGETDHDVIRPVVMGNSGLLRQLGQLLQPPAKGGLGARLMNM